ncbi:MAG: tRNA epoxyqueuosine(34) reductase QueG [Bacteroidota bacterium]
MINTPEEKIKNEARKLGFDFCGIAHSDILSFEKNELEKRIEKGFHAEMDYLARNTEQRANPELLLDSAQSVIITLTNYHIKNPTQLKNYCLPRYAMFPDYHKAIREKLTILKEHIHQSFPEAKTHSFVDASPIFEKAWAVRTGAGSIGKNTLLIHPKRGSFVFIGGIITNIKLNANKPSHAFDPCQNCSRCIEACPTQALKEPYMLDASRCIAYLTIESKQSIPEEFSKNLKGNIFGCDICQDVCPWNHRISVLPAPSQKQLGTLTDEILENLNEELFHQYFDGLPVKRAGLEKLKQNIKAAKN